MKSSQTRGTIAAGVIAVVGLGIGVGIGIGIGAGIWSEAGTKPPQPEWFFAQQSSKARISKASAPSETMFVTLDGLSEEATVGTDLYARAAPTLVSLALRSLARAPGGDCQADLRGVHDVSQPSREASERRSRQKCNTRLWRRYGMDLDR